ncbi:MAG: aminodeoxychorismate synthase component I [Gemmatimonadaceae bacterium]
MTTPNPHLTAILDFAEGPSGDPVRRCFGRASRELRADNLADVISVIDGAERLARGGQWIVGFVAYEAAPAFDPALSAHSRSPLPLAWFAAFDSPEPASSPPTHATDSTHPRPSVVLSAHAPLPPRTAVLTPSSGVSDDVYARHVGRIRDYIAAGDVYQVNLTLPFTAESTLAPLALYEQMRRSQAGAYSAYLNIGDVEIMSASPELFVQRVGTRLRSKPMKGTAERGLHPTADLNARTILMGSEKERAENVMIVDVVRNDLGRVATVGTVRVPALCVAERYPSVWQLTSTVEADVSEDLPLSRVFSALFPAASITGAPKIRATEIIRDLERATRGVYCGAIGCIRPGGDATFNVAIRTAWTDDGGRTLHLNAGGGVTMDSTATSELAELRAKLSAFTRARFEPTLFETIRIERGRPIRLARHLARMGTSAEYFGQPFDAPRAEAILLAAAFEARELETARGRLVLEPTGLVRATVESFAGDAGSPLPRLVQFAPTPMDRNDVRLYHKTTDRSLYDSAGAGASERFDTLLWNADEQATELTRGNLVVELDGTRWTPPVECGLLGGTFRAELLEMGEIHERVVTLDELMSADRRWFVNSLRGWVPIALAD